MLLNVAISILDDLLDPKVDLLGVEPLIDDQSVHLVENQAGFDLGLPCLFDHRGGLRAHTLNHIDHDEGAV